MTYEQRQSSGPVTLHASVYVKPDTLIEARVQSYRYQDEDPEVIGVLALGGNMIRLVPDDLATLDRLAVGLQDLRTSWLELQAELDAKNTAQSSDSTGE